MKNKTLKSWLQIGMLSCLLILAGRVPAADIYVMSSGDPTLDNVVASTLTSRGHQVTVGVQYTQFDGSQSLAGYDVVYLQANYNWNTGDMPLTGQQALLGFVQSGGGLVTCEWVIWKAAAQGSYATLRVAFPVVLTSHFNGNATGTFTQVTADPTINAGLPASFTFPIVNYAGTESDYNATQAGATIFYDSVLNGTRRGVVGWNYGNGRVLMFSTTNGVNQINDARFGRLLSNTMSWASREGAVVEGDVNGDGCVNDADLAAVIFEFGGPESGTFGNTDLNDDGIVDDSDLATVIFNFGVGC